jgi:hypothetical protein
MSQIGLQDGEACEHFQVENKNIAPFEIAEVAAAFRLGA